MNNNWLLIDILTETMGARKCGIIFAEFWMKIVEALMDTARKTFKNKCDVKISTVNKDWLYHQQTCS